MSTTQTERDELAKLLFSHHVTDRAAETAPRIIALCESAADQILAAGYRRPRTITTVEELIALPDRSVIRDKFGDVAERRDSWWCSYETAPCGDGRQAKYLPATVLHDGGAA